MVPINVSHSERQALNDMVGRAILDDKVGRDLLRQDTRRSVLDEYVLSRRVMRHLMSLNDMPNVADFADVLYKTIKH